MNYHIINLVINVLVELIPGHKSVGTIVTSLFDVTVMVTVDTIRTQLFKASLA